MADVNKAAEIQALVDHNQGQGAPNMTNWSSGARDAYQAQTEAIRRQEEAKKNT
jgi:hypothetical protein